MKCVSFLSRVLSGPVKPSKWDPVLSARFLKTLQSKEFFRNWISKHAISGQGRKQPKTNKRPPASYIGAKGRSKLFCRHQVKTLCRPCAVLLGRFGFAGSFVLRCIFWESICFPLFTCYLQLDSGFLPKAALGQSECGMVKGSTNLNPAYANQLLFRSRNL